MIAAVVAINRARALVVVTDAAAHPVRGLFIGIAYEITARYRNVRRVVPLRFRPCAALEAFQKFAECLLAIQEAVGDVTHAPRCQPLIK